MLGRSWISGQRVYSTISRTVSAIGSGLATGAGTSTGIPNITTTSLSIATKPGLDTLVGHVDASNSPTSYNIVGGNPNTYFAIFSTGNLRTSASVTPIPDNDYSITVTATNGIGTSAPATITVRVGAVPVITDASFNLTLPATSGQNVGTVTTPGSTPTSFSITAGNASGYFAINANGVITVTSAGASGLSQQTYNLTVQATSALGTDTGAIAVVASQPTAIPMSLNDSRFATNTTKNFGDTGTITVNNADLIESPNYPSGDSCLVYYGGGTMTMNKCRIDWREGPRIDSRGQTCNFIMNECFVNVVGYDIDHADGLQPYNNGGAQCNITLTNCYFKGYSDAEAVAKYGPGFVEATAGLRWADYTTGTVTISNCIIDCSQYKMYINADTGTTHVNFDHVYMVGGVGGFAVRPTGGTLVVDQWNEVRWATVSGGVLVPGDLIPTPPFNY